MKVKSTRTCKKEYFKSIRMVNERLIKLYKCPMTPVGQHDIKIKTSVIENYYFKVVAYICSCKVVCPVHLYIVVGHLPYYRGRGPLWLWNKKIVSIIIEFMKYEKILIYILSGHLAAESKTDNEC